MESIDKETTVFYNLIKRSIIFSKNTRILIRTLIIRYKINIIHYLLRLSVRVYTRSLMSN